MASYTTGRHRYARGPVSEDVKKKLMDRLQNDQDFELFAEDIIEVMGVARNDPDGFRAANRELDRLASFDSEKVIGKGDRYWQCQINSHRVPLRRN